MTVSNDELLTTPEAAAFLRRSRQSLEIMRHRRQGPPYIKIGKVLYRKTDLQAYLDANTHRPGEAGACPARVAKKAAASERPQGQDTAAPDRIQDMQRTPKAMA